jgi:NifU-like protein involved in Fe-S cluster formation
VNDLSAPAASSATVHVDSPLCGDVVDLTATVAGDRVISATYRSRACSLVVASARLLADAVPLLSVADARELAVAVDAALRGARPLPAGFEGLSAVLLMPSRRGCALLPWRALAQALGAIRP